MKLTRYAIIMAAAVMSMPMVYAEDDGPKFTIKPTGRILMDGAVYMGGNSGVSDDYDEKFVDGVAIPDLRLGAKASYGKWKAKIDVGFAYGKVGLKDTYFEYDINDANFLRGGYFVPNWGLNSETSSSMKPSYEEPSSNEFFAANPRMLALMWEYNKGQFLTATSIFAEANVMTQKANVMKKQGWGAETRLVWRPRHVNYDVTQIGISLNYTSPNNADHNGFTFSSNFPTRVSQINCMDAIVDHANGAFKLSPEFLLIKNRIAFETQYYFLDIFRHKGYNNFQAHGAYGMFRAQLIGSGYCYNMADGGVATPGKGTLELVLGYNYTDASDKHAGVWGGVSNDANLTFNYYINNWMIARLRYSYTEVHDRKVEDLLPKRHVNTIEARLQIIF